MATAIELARVIRGETAPPWVSDLVAMIRGVTAVRSDVLDAIVTARAAVGPLAFVVRPHVSTPVGGTRGADPEQG